MSVVLPMKCPENILVEILSRKLANKRRELRWSRLQILIWEQKVVEALWVEESAAESLRVRRVGGPQQDPEEHQHFKMWTEKDPSKETEEEAEW